MTQIHGQGWSRDYALVAEAIRHLDDHRVRQPAIGEVAAALHVSTGHLQRTFTRLAGVSPHRFLRWLTFGAARELLRERATVLEVTAATGLSSSGRLHDLTVDLVAMTPGQLAEGGAGLTLRTGTHPTPLGPAAITVAPRGVVDLRFLDADDEHALPEVAARWPGAEVVADAVATREVADRLGAILGAGGDRARPRLEVLAVGTNLQVRVWEALLRVPDDRVVSYGEVARAAGAPHAVRAVASAIGRNPVAVLIPCHRVLRATGELGGYRWGTTRKRILLAREAALADQVREGSGTGGAAPDAAASAPAR